MIPGLGRSPEEGKGYPLQCSGLENPMDCIVHRVTESWTQLSDFHFISLHAPSHRDLSHQPCPLSCLRAASLGSRKDLLGWMGHQSWPRRGEGSVESGPDAGAPRKLWWSPCVRRVCPEQAQLSWRLSWVGSPQADPAPGHPSQGCDKEELLGEAGGWRRVQDGARGKPGRGVIPGTRP